MAYVCVVGDPDSHGGSITSGDGKLTIQGNVVAIVTSSVSPDPIPGHSGKSVTGPGHGRNITIHGKKVIVSGAPVSCGASTVASLQSKFSIG